MCSQKNWLPSKSTETAALVDELQVLCKGKQLDKALDVLSCMDKHNIDAPTEIYRSLLKECGNQKALAQAKLLHAHLARHGSDNTWLLGESLVSTLVKCGGLKEALQVFRKLPSRTVVAWTAIISGYTRAGEGKKALKLYYLMRRKGVDPDTYTFVSLLKACSITANLKEGKRIHSDAVKYGCASDLFVGTSLLDMYAKCGSVDDALEVFEDLPQQDIVSWRAMLAAYAQQGLASKSFQLYERMLKAGVSPDEHVLMLVLKACTTSIESERGAAIDKKPRRVDIVEIGKAIEAEAWKSNHGPTAKISSTLISIFGKCGSVGDAQQAFESFPHRDVVTWTAILGAYVKSEPEKTWELYTQMLQQEGVSPDGATFAVALQACSMLAEKENSLVIEGHSLRTQSLQRGKIIHAEACKTSYGLEVTLCNALTSMYSKCGSFMDAENVFRQLPQADSVSWNAMLGAYALQENAMKVMQSYELMLEEGVSPNHRTFASVLHACSILSNEVLHVEDGNRAGQGIRLQKGKVVHAEAWKRGCMSDVFIGSSLVSMYSKCGSIEDAEHVFNGLSVRDCVTYNAMLAAYSSSGQADKALQLYEQMLEEGRNPDAWSFVPVLQACGSLAGKEEVEMSLHKGKLVHAKALQTVDQLDDFVASSLISMYGQCGSIPDAERVFNGLYRPNMVSWNALLTAYAEQGQGVEALQLFRRFWEGGLVSPDDSILISTLKSCGQTGGLDLCIEIHNSIVLSGSSISLPVASALIHAYSQCAKMAEAQKVLDSLNQPDVVCWTALIAGYARQGSWETSSICYQKMCDSGVKPNGVTFLSLLSACCHAGMVSKGVEYFESMSRDYGIVAEIEHYVSLVDLFGRAGHLRRVEELLLNMPVRPNLSAWLCLLGACRKHRNVALGRWAFNCALLLQPKDAAAYSLMHSIYAQSGMWEQAREVSNLREVAGAWKKPGKSWIGHQLAVNMFVAGHWHESCVLPLDDILEEVSLQLMHEVLIPHTRNMALSSPVTI